MPEILNRDSILNIDDLPRERVAVPEWGGGEVIVRALTAAERDTYNSTLFQVRPRGRSRDPEVVYNPQNATARLVALCVVDDEGNRLFKDTDLERLANKNARALERIAAVARRLSGLDEESQGDIEGNSGPSRKGGSSSG